MALKSIYRQQKLQRDMRDVRPIQGNTVIKVSDIQLWEEFQSGSETAYATIYENNASSLYNYGLKLVDNKDLVMDAIQDLFVELWNIKERLGKVKSIKAYLYTSFRRKIISQNTRQKEIFHAGTDIPLKDGDPSAEFSLIEKQRFDREQKELKFALDKLSKKQQEIIYLKYYECLSYEEISRMMSMDKKATYNLMARTIQLLRQSLGTLTLLGILFFLA